MKQRETGADMFFYELFQMDFFNDQFWNDDIRREPSELKEYLLQGMKLINCLFEEKQLKNLVSELTDKQKNTLISAIEYLTEAFASGKVKILKEQLPLLLCLAEVAQNEEILPVVFREWWENVIRL